ncbi:DUF2231 domain-containing protein [Propioniciclava soli]|uniref:DUF2231 domain-containing protein n=1 Tax=Propioniciclava soli TaxID=2775081 RepID=A0ABZ3C2J8_9ACTN|nr:DUF2231 domain-containing protein [Propioniciclava soli]
MNDTLLGRAAAAVEDAEGLDAPATILRDVAPKLPRPLLDVLTGRAVGSPLHPALVHLPIGAAISALVVELVGGETQASSARLLAGLTVASAVPAAWTGLADYASAYGAGARRVGAAHALLNAAGTTLALAAVATGGATRRPIPTLLIAGSVGAYLAGGFLGGHLVHAREQTAPGA